MFAVAAGEDHRDLFEAWLPSGLEANAGVTADQHHDLPGEVGGT
jgi:hypothetical protein